MTRSCRLPGCDEDRRGRDNAPDGFAANFCSDTHELKYEHVRADARDAQRAAEERATEDNR